MRSDKIARSQTGQLLDVLLNAPDLVRGIRTLPGPAVTALVRRVGLEDGGELIALLSTEQLTELLDDVLWEGEVPGATETFDPHRFAIWLEVMLEAGDGFAADRLAALSEDLVTLAVSRLAFVLDLAEVEAQASEQDGGELVEKALDSCLHHEIGDYFLVARYYDGWDALIAALAALDTRHSDLLERILQRCWSAAHEQLDDAGGLYDLLTAEELFEVDAAAEREARRAALGYVSPASARAFLTLAARRESIARGKHDPVTRAYFRELDPSRASRHRAPGPAKQSRIAELVAGAIESPQPSATEPAPSGVQLRLLLQSLAAKDAARHQSAVEELAYLTNVLVAGGGSRGRPLRPAEAADQAVEVCERGLVELAAPQPPTAQTIAEWGLVAAFRAGWSH